MRGITKGAEPRSLTEHRMTTFSSYENYDDKDSLREALVREQLGICCYCMGRIRADKDSMKIEHWQSQDSHPERQLDYANLLGACSGSEGSPHTQQHCDTRKGNLPLKYNPSAPDHRVDLRVRYDSDGRIISDDPEFDAQLNDVLNLNLALLLYHRRGMLDTVLCWWKREQRRLQSAVPTEQVQRQIRKLTDLETLKPYSPVAVWWLQQKLNKRQR